MKKLFSILLVLMGALVMAQAPEAINYQTIIRADDGTPTPYSVMDFQFSILEGSASGSTVYSEEHTVTSNGNGLISLKIGQGGIVSGEFSAIDWGAATYFLKIEAKQNGSPNYIIMGTEEFASVPYALFAKTTAATDNMWQQSGDDIYFMNGNVGIKTDDPEEALTLGENERFQVSTVKNSLSTGGLIKLRWNTNEAKPGIHWQDMDGLSKVALSAYEFQSAGNPDPKFSIATTNLAGELVERFHIPWGQDEVDIKISDANLLFTDGNTFQIGNDINSGMAKYYGDVFIHESKKLGIGDKDWETLGTYGNAKMEIYRQDSDVELLIHDDAGTNDVGLHLRRGEDDWDMTHNGSFNINHEGSNYFKITSDGDVGIGVDVPIAKLDVNGNINVSSGYAYLVGGTGKAAYLPVGGALVSGDIAGLNPESGEIRKFQNGDVFIGVASKQAGFIENYAKDREKDANYALIVSKGQLEVDLSQVSVNGRIVYTNDGQEIGVLLNNNKVFIK